MKIWWQFFRDLHELHLHQVSSETNIWLFSFWKGDYTTLLSTVGIIVSRSNESLLTNQYNFLVAQVDLFEGSWGIHHVWSFWSIQSSLISLLDFFYEFMFKSMMFDIYIKFLQIYIPDI